MNLLEEAFGLAGIPLDEAQCKTLSGLYDLLREEALTLGFSGIRGDKEIVAKHLVDSGHLAQWLRTQDCSGKVLVDIGTGPGLPGLVVRLLVPQLKRVDLVDSKGRAVEWLRKVASDLGMDGLGFRWDRAETLGLGPEREAYDLVTLRAVGTLTVSMEYGLPLVKPGGLFLGMRGVDPEIEQGEGVSHHLGAHLHTVVPYQLPWDLGTRHLVIFQRDKACPPQFPREPHIIRKRPLVFHVKHFHDR